MEFHIRKSSDNECSQSYIFNPEDLADIPHPDDFCDKNSPQEDIIDLPLPPGTSGDDFPMPLGFKQQPAKNSNNAPPISQNEGLEKSSDLDPGLMSENFNILPLSECIQSTGFGASELEHDEANKPMDIVDDSKYSPSKMDSDEDNQDLVTTKPKVLGKEQAKKRLMAFSLSKQPSTSVKKQSKAVTPVKNKEKPPNPNKGTNVQEQFRATISAIEEEKKKMFQNMPNYLLHEMNDLTKSSYSSPSLQLLEKLKSERSDSKGKNSSSRDGRSSNRSPESSRKKKSSRKNRSRSNSPYKSKKRRRSRSKRRSRSNSKSSRSRRRSHSRSRRRSHSRSRNRRSRSHSKRRRDEKNYKSTKESQSEPKKKSPENWSCYKSGGLVVENNSKSDTKSRHAEHKKRSRSPINRTDFKPIFNYLNKGCNSAMTSLQARPADPNNSTPALFSEKTLKFTRTKPILCWAENPLQATDYYMSRQMLLENCDQATASILLSIIENKNIGALEKQFESQPSKSRPWYPRDDYLLMNVNNDLESNESNSCKKSLNLDAVFEKEQSETSENKKDINSAKEEAKRDRASLERKISLVNDSYLSDEDDQIKEMIVGEVKVQLDLDKNRVKVRSKWDSDYEGETSEKESISKVAESRDTGALKVQSQESSSDMKDDKIIESLDFNLDPGKPSEKKKGTSRTLSSQNVTQVESPNANPKSDAAAGNLVSEYEEFLKMVSVDSSDNQKEKTLPELPPKLEKQKTKLVDKSSEESRKSSKLGLTDWDQESDREEKSTAKKTQFTSAGSHDEFLILKEEKLDGKKEGKRKKKGEKKSEILKEKKVKALKKSGKVKKKKYSYSEDSSSESNDSDSDSDDSGSSGKKKSKKYSKSKKKVKKVSSSESDSDSDESTTKRKKSKPKKARKKKDSSSDSDQAHNSPLKQLDYKKQIIMTKIEEMDYVSDKSSKKKKKESRTRKKDSDSSEDTDSEKYNKAGKKKKSEVKAEKEKKKSKTGIKKNKLLGKTKKIKKSESSSESDSETSEDSVKRKKSKKSEKKKQDRSEDSSSDERGKKSTKSKSSGKSNKKHKRARKDSSSSDSDSDDSSKGKKKGRKKEEMEIDDEKHPETIEASLKENLLLKESDTKPLVWERKKLWKKVEERRAKRKEDDDWEASSSTEESEEESKARESSWDDETTIHEPVTKVTEGTVAKSDVKDTVQIKQAIENSQDAPELMTQLSSGTLKGSLSVFSFNENSFCSFGQELSRDFFLTDLNCSNSGHPSGIENSKIGTIEPRPFQSVSRDGEIKKAARSELYSPGHSDSEVSDVEVSKPEKLSSNLICENKSKEEVYDPLNCDSEGSGENNKVELSSIPLPRVSDILLPGETRTFENLSVILPSNSEGSALKNLPHDSEKLDIKYSSMTPPLKSSFSSNDFTPVVSSQSPLNEDKNTPTKRQLMSVKGQTKLISKAASVFQDESDEENIEPSSKGKTTEGGQNEPSDGPGDTKCKERDNLVEEKPKRESGKYRKGPRERSKERSSERSGKRKRSRSREGGSRSKSSSKKESSPRTEKKVKVSDTGREKREIRSDSFEIEPLKSCIESDVLTDLVQPIPVLTGLEPSTDSLWSRSVLPVSKFSHAADNLIDNGESFDIYPSEESTYRKDHAEQDEISLEKLKHHRNKKESRRSRSKSHSPKTKHRSKSPEKRRSPRNRSPRRKSASPKRKEKSPFSPKRRSPKRKSPSRRYKKSSRSPDKRRKSRSRSPRKRRGSPRRSRSVSPRKYRSPKHLDESPRRRDSSATTFSPARESFSPRKDAGYLHPQPVLHNRIPVIGTSTSVDDPDRELSPSAMGSPMFENSGAFPRHMPDQSFQEPNMYSSFYEGEYSQEFGMSSYPEEVSANNLITVKNHDIEKTTSSERLSLDQRIELELGVAMSAGSQTQSDQYQVCPQFQDTNYFQNSCNCDNGNVSTENFYQNQSVQMNDFNGQYFNGHQPQSNFRPFQKYPSSQTVQNSVLQVGNIVEVVPTSQHPPPALPSVPSKPTPQIMQVGNVLQVVPSQKPISQNYPEGSPVVKTQKATAVVAPSSVVPTPNPEAVLSPLIKAIQLEREKRRKEKAKRKAEREARRKARQLRREAKLMLVNEKLKKSVQNEGLMLGQEVEDDELLDGLDVPSPPIPVEIITVSSPNALPPAGKGILITAGFMPKPPSEKKEVKFADGVCPGEGTSTSGGEEIASPPPKPKLPKEKRFKKRKTKVKKKVKVQIIRQIIQEEDDDEDDLSPPPPPPGDPPPVFFARFPFAGEAQFPVYQTQTTTTTLTTVQYPNPSFE